MRFLIAVGMVVSSFTHGPAAPVPKVKPLDARLAGEWKEVGRNFEEDASGTKCVSAVVFKDGGEIRIRCWSPGSKDDPWESGPGKYTLGAARGKTAIASLDWKVANPVGWEQPKFQVLKLTADEMVLGDTNGQKRYFKRQKDK